MNEMTNKKDEEAYAIKLTPEQKLAQSIRLYWYARELKRAGLKMIYPELSKDEIEKKVRDIFLYARD
jgi:hypothetical protein